MIDTGGRVNPVRCTGCSACASVCPVGAITMQPDVRGFMRPATDAEKCINCGRCTEKCPVGNAYHTGELGEDGVLPCA